MFKKALLVICIIVLVSFTFAASDVVLRFYFPVGVAGPLAQYIGELCQDFSDNNPGIIVEPIYSGGYAETLQRALTAAKSGNSADIALLTAADVWTAVDEGILSDLNPFIESEGGDTFLAPYFKAFLEDCNILGTYYALPFQKSTPIFYYNKDMFVEAGIDPESPPETWDELMEYAKKLVIKEDGEIKRWGVEIPIDQWLLSAFSMQNGGLINNPEGTETYLNSPEVIGALEFLRSLAEEEVMPPRRLFGDSSSDFVAGTTAMMYNSTGSLTFVRTSATFDWGVAFLPGNVRKAVPTGGGQLVIMSDIPEERKEAAWKFIKWMTEPEQTAFWSIKTGYVPIREEAFELPEMIDYIAEVPGALVAKEQLKYVIVGEPPATHNARQISRIMTDAMEAVIAGNISAEEALNQAQEEAERVLRFYQ
ncbi:MAG: sn-glycerol 3-phosphate transport system substrate-binding protein [Kosmotogales bacterium]|nr:sn-glycerol 3-phosphate transport system substrate-binding protein [Kosmotogales bacterium]